MMMRSKVSKILLASAAAVCVGASAMAADFEALIRSDGLAPAPTTLPYRYIVDVETTGAELGDFGETDLEPLTARLSIDHTRPEGQRVQIIQQSAADTNSNKALRKLVKDLEKQARSEETLARGFWCAPEIRNPDGAAQGGISAAEMRVASEDRQRVSLRPDSDQLANMMMTALGDDLGSLERKLASDLAAQLEGELTLSKPDLMMEGMDVWLRAPVPVMLIASLDEMTLTQGCAPAPNGYPYISDYRIKLGLSVFGQRSGTEMRLNVSELVPLD